MSLNFSNNGLNYTPKGGGGSVTPTGTKTITENGTYDVTTYASASVDVATSEPTIASLTITPSTTAQTYTAPTGTDGYSPISVGAVTSSIDKNITAGNIKSGVSILCVSGTVTELVGATTTITTNGTYTPTGGANGFTSVSVNVESTTPTGTYTITSNGTYDVTDYATADVSVSGGGGGQTVMRGDWVVPQEYVELDGLVSDKHETDSPVATIGLYFDRNSISSYKFSTSGYSVTNFKFYSKNGEKTPQLVNDFLYEIPLAQDENYLISTYVGTQYAYLYTCYFPTTGNGRSSGTTEIFEQMNAIKYATAIGACAQTDTVGNMSYYNNMDEFHCLTPMPFSATMLKYRNNLKYIPSVTEANYIDNIYQMVTAYVGGGVLQTIAGIHNLPYGGDFTNCTVDWDFSTNTTSGGGYYINSIRLKQMYITLPNSNVTLNGAASSVNTVGINLSADNWAYIAQHAPTVSNKTLKINAFNESALGSTNKATLQSKGWTVTVI